MLALLLLFGYSGMFVLEKQRRSVLEQMVLESHSDALTFIESRIVVTSTEI